MKSSLASRVEALDLLRLIAVIAVIAYHYGFRGPSIDGINLVAIPAMASWAQYGYLGVPAFFVISGFVIAYSAEKRTATDFAVARFSRIYPTFLFCMTMTFLTVMLLGKPSFETSFTQWAANLFIGAPALQQRYMDDAYWSLVVEVTFYFWVMLLISIGLFPRRIDAVVLAWICIALTNEITIDALIVEKVFLADYCGYFATGLMIYEHFKGRRDAMLFAILVLSIGVAVFHTVHNLEWLRFHSGTEFSNGVASLICLVSIALIFLATRIRSLPIPANIVIAVGGITYPLYLLHLQIGYTIFAWAAPVRVELYVAAILIGIALMSWVTWRYVERPAHRWTRQQLARLSSRFGWSSKPT